MPPPNRNDNRNNDRNSDFRSKIEQELRNPGSRSGDEYKSAQGNPVRPGRRPPMRVMTSTLWEYPSQHYDAQNGSKFQGSKDYIGATPSWIIWQLLTRYTRENDTVLDPMCGSGTTLDVCNDLGRKGIGFDLNPQRQEIAHADARELPMADESVDFAFIDPPYSTHVDYSDDDRCIGKLDASEEMQGDDVMPGHAYYESMDMVLSELHRVMKPNRYIGLYVSDSWKKRSKQTQPGLKGGVFMPIGFELFATMREYFQPVDIITVVRHNKKLKQGNWHKSAEKENFFLRGFNYLFIMKKVD